MNDDDMDITRTPNIRQAEHDAIAEQVAAYIENGGIIKPVEGYEYKEAAKRGSHKNRSTGMNPTRTHIYRLICAGHHRIAGIARRMNTNHANVSNNVKWLVKEKFVERKPGKRGQYHKVEGEE